jgi:hypothetical protein
MECGEMIVEVKRLKARSEQRTANGSLKIKLSADCNNQHSSLTSVINYSLFIVHYSLLHFSSFILHPSS